MGFHRDESFEYPLKGEAGSMPASSGERTPQKPPDNLPRERSKLVGREKEVAQVGSLLDGGQRLITLYGPGGAGKTRLALAVAREVVGRFGDGVWWVELAHISDPGLVAGALASALGVREAPDRPLTEVLVEQLEPGKALLVLDNCEHLVEGCADLAGILLKTCQDLQMLATSREPLRVAGEAVWMVPSLSLPDPQNRLSSPELAGYEAVSLFVERAQEADAGFALTEKNASAVTRLCSKLDGIPLAIELAAARIRVLTVEQISERLEDPLALLTRGRRTAAPRHQTLRAALEWSYELLSKPEQKLFARLSAFVGGWTLDAADTVGAGTGIEEGEVLDLLLNLVDKSLVVADVDGDGASRQRLLETVRQYAAEALASSGEENAVRERHALFFLDLAERAEPELSASEQVSWLDCLELELGNLRAAARWFRENRRWPAYLRLAGALWRFCYLRGHYVEGRGWLKEALDHGDEAPLPARAKAYLGAGTLTFLQCEYEGARDLLEEALALYRTLGDDRGVASVSQMLGSIARERGEYARSEALHEESLSIWRGLGDEVGEARSLNYLAYAAWLQEKHERAKALCEETLGRFRNLGDNEVVVWALISLGCATHYSGDYRGGRTILQESLALSQEVGYTEGVAWSLNQLGIIAHREGEGRRAMDLLRESLGIHQELGDRWRAASVLDAIAEAFCVADHPGPAACLFGAAGAVRESISVPVPLCERVDREESISSARAELGDAAFEAAFSEGQTLSPEQAVECAWIDLEKPPATVPAMAPVEERTRSEEKPAGSVEAKLTDTGLRIYALGPARVEKEGSTLDSPDWTLKPRELLYYLLSHPQGRTKEQIGLTLWPEASTAQLRSSFHDTVFRLRRALGAKEWVSYGKGRYAFGRELPYSFDVEDFEKSLSEARRLRSESPEQVIEHLQEATSVYAGDFLEDLASGEWALQRQDELRRNYQDALLLLGGLLNAQGRQVEAIEAYRKAIAHDRLLEEAHRGLMRTQAALGERGRAMRHYEDLAMLLDEHLGTSPAQETVDLYESMRAGEAL